MRISEDFYSVQGEGISAGVPAYFIRLQGCNLMCGGTQNSLVKLGKASWWCDTEDVWKKGKEVSDNELVDKFIAAGQLENILDGVTHLVWTGGEPTLPHHQLAIENFLNGLHEAYPTSTPYNEIETNGTRRLGLHLYSAMDQINCSPKLANSGMPEHTRIIPVALEEIRDHPGGWFKFVVSYETDIAEIERDFVIPYSIPTKQVILMPGVDNLRDLSERTRFVYEMTKKYGYRSSTRGQVLAWDKTTGV